MSYIYIDQQADFENLCRTFLDEPQLALDTEFVRRSTYYPILALLQVASKSDIYLIDPQGISDWSPLAELFRSDVRILMHSCSEDLEVFRRAVGQLPTKLFDTQIAAAYLGRGDSLGYAALVAQMTGEEIDKSETQSDWLRRPLSASQLDYAAADVRWLISIADELTQALEEKGRLDWVEQEISALNEKYISEPEAHTVWLRLKGVGRLQAKDWPLAAKLCEWREQTARQRDKPKSWIVKDTELLEVIQHRPSNASELSRLRDISPTTQRHHGKHILEWVAQANDLPMPDSEPVPDLDGADRKVLKRLQQFVSGYAEREGLAQRFIASKQELSQFILYHSSRLSGVSALDQGWRKELLGAELKALLGSESDT